MKKMTEDRTVEISVSLLDDLRKQAGRGIDPKSAEAMKVFVETLDPYNEHADFPEEYHQISNDLFYKNPDSSVWIGFGDVPEEIREAIHARLQREPQEDRLPWD